MKIAKYTLIALVSSAIGFGGIANAADDSAAASGGNFYVKVGGGYGLSNDREISYKNLKSLTKFNIVGTVTNTTGVTAVAAVGDTPAIAAVSAKSVVTYKAGDNTLYASTATGPATDGVTVASTFTDTDYAALALDSGKVTIPVSASEDVSNTLKFDDMRGVTFSGAVGYNISDSVRAEVAYTYAKSSMKHRDEHNVFAELSNAAHELTVGGFYDIDAGSDLVPFIGLAAGLSRSSVSMKDLDLTGIGQATKSLSTEATFSDDARLLAKAVVGGSVQLAEGINLDLAYELKGTFFSVSADKNGKDNLEKLGKHKDVDGKDITDTAVTDIGFSKDNITRAAPSLISQNIKAELRFEF